MSGSRGPLSHPNARRQNLKPAKVYLPAEGYQGPIPDWPLVEGQMVELERWGRLWRTPMAAQWVRMGIETVVARYVRLALQAEDSGSKLSVAESNVKGAVTALEKELGLSPAALKRLEWEIVADEVGDKREEVQRPASRRIRAVDEASA